MSDQDEALRIYRENKQIIDAKDKRIAELEAAVAEKDKELAKAKAEMRAYVEKVGKHIFGDK